MADFAAIYRAEARPVLATLIRLLGGFDLAEEALHDAWLAALDQWPREGVPRNPRSWLVSTGRFKAIDKLRRKARFDRSQDELILRMDVPDEPFEVEPQTIVDDQLRLIFTCCHPALAPDAQVALTLREIAGLTTEDIAAAYLTKPTTIAQRIVRAKAKIRDARIPYEVPEPAELADRLETVLHVLYLIFNAGYSAPSGLVPLRTDLSSEAIRLMRLVNDLIDEPDAKGLLALMLLNDARRDARLDVAGELVPLDEQDRARWNRPQIDEGAALVAQIFAERRLGAYSIQAAIAAEHGQSATAEATDWQRIVSLYDLLLRLEPSPIVDLNRAVAVAMAHGPEVGLAIVDRIDADGSLSQFHLLHATRADLLRRAGRTHEARTAYAEAIALSQQEAERRFLQRRLNGLPS
ncbi:RNA polymerase sigma factor [Devosia sp. SL43]|uniref:RNA polymerase sigma factor n=1 Tax=Devosia sp. SL43 TaxID=2806348 RepID=UPI001F28274E|nr:RNA polymerase sigma factor [Devosia sp. SL43]UJW85069.1 RNA polymerase sigma factor [Devosia sp. SL43]